MIKYLIYCNSKKIYLFNITSLIIIKMLYLSN